MSATKHWQAVAAIRADECDARSFEADAAVPGYGDAYRADMMQRASVMWAAAATKWRALSEPAPEPVVARCADGTCDACMAAPPLHGAPIPKGELICDHGVPLLDCFACALHEDGAAEAIIERAEKRWHGEHKPAGNGWTAWRDAGPVPSWRGDAPYWVRLRRGPDNPLSGQPVMLTRSEVKELRRTGLNEQEVIGPMLPPTVVVEVGQ